MTEYPGHTVQDTLKVRITAAEADKKDGVSGEHHFEETAVRWPIIHDLLVIARPQHNIISVVLPMRFKDEKRIIRANRQRFISANIVNIHQQVWDIGVGISLFNQVVVIGC